MSTSTDMRVRTGTRTVTAAGTREVFITGSLGNVRVKNVTIRALTTNTGLVYIWGLDSLAGFPLSAGGSCSIEVTDKQWDYGAAINLAKLWIDSAVNGEGVAYIIVSD